MPARTGWSTTTPSCSRAAPRRSARSAASRSPSADDLRLYLIETAEKGIAWMKLTATGRAGHGSMINDDNAVTALCEAVARLGRHEFPVRVTKTVRTFLGEISDALGIELDPDDMDATVAKLGPLATIIGATLRNTVNPTMLRPATSTTSSRARRRRSSTAGSCPGYEEEFFAHDRRAARAGRHARVRHPRHRPRDRLRRRSRRRDVRVAAGRGPRRAGRAVHAVRRHRRKVVLLLGIRCFGFAPLQLPPDLDFAGMFHGVDERVPGRRPAVRDPRARPVPRPRLSRGHEPVADLPDDPAPQPDPTRRRPGRGAAGPAPSGRTRLLGQGPPGLLARRPARGSSAR